MAAAHPRLPTELEREILEITARLYPEMRYKLLFVARRVLIWIERLLYRTINFDGSKYPRIPTKPPHFFATHTRHIVLDWYESSEVPKLCTGVTHVALIPGAVPEFLRNLRQLQFFICHSDELQVWARTVDGASLPVFASLTHLELFDHKSTPFIEGFCARLPALTHLALAATTLKFNGWTTMEHLLQRCKVLELLVLLTGSIHDAESVALDVPCRPNDIRFVITCRRHDLTEGVSDCYAYWDVADAFVAQKRRGLVQVFLAQRH
ncbi:hypothetical protein C8F01DRAFT_1370464 [Mycena amicta]|nr:hypothetical protein C8F01DRAFT_1370464 [Mycena amicta]